jgi:hypothetical protein
MKGRFVCLSCGHDYPLSMRGEPRPGAKRKPDCKACGEKARVRGARPESQTQAIRNIAAMHWAELPRRA